jgi:hypothetical protein
MAEWDYLMTTPRKLENQKSNMQATPVEPLEARAFEQVFQVLETHFGSKDHWDDFTFTQQPRTPNQELAMKMVAKAACDFPKNKVFRNLISEFNGVILSKVSLNLHSQAVPSSEPTKVVPPSVPSEPTKVQIPLSSEPSVVAPPDNEWSDFYIKCCLESAKVDEELHSMLNALRSKFDLKSTSVTKFHRRM